MPVFDKEVQKQRTRADGQVVKQQNSRDQLKGWPLLFLCVDW